MVFWILLNLPKFRTPQFTNGLQRGKSSGLCCCLFSAGSSRQHRDNISFRSRDDRLQKRWSNVSNLMAAAYLNIADTVLYCCGQRYHSVNTRVAMDTSRPSHGLEFMCCLMLWAWFDPFPWVGKRTVLGKIFLPKVGKWIWW